MDESRLFTGETFRLAGYPETDAGFLFQDKFELKCFSVCFLVVFLCSLVHLFFLYCCKNESFL